MGKDIFRTLDVTTPLNGRVVYKDAYWACVDGDPTKALFYGDSPQCNNQELIMTHNLSGRNMYKDLNVQIVFISTAFVPRRP